MPIDVAFGTSSRNSPSRFASIAEVNRVIPVTLPPGLLKLATSPAFSGGPLIHERIGTIAGLLFVLLGMSMRPALAPLLLLLVLMNIGYAVAVVPVSDQSKPVT